jgi:hypothetical protein
MTKILTLLLFTISAFCFSQKYVDAVIIKSDNDTIKSKMKVSTNIFYKNLIDEKSFYRVLLLLDENDKKKEKIKAIEVKKLLFTDFEGKQRIYVSVGKTLGQLMFDGKKIKWIRDILVNAYDGSVSYSDYLVDKSGEEYRFNGLFLNPRKRLIEATKSKPELATLITDTDRFSDENVLNILQKYDEQ